MRHGFIATVALTLVCALLWSGLLFGTRAVGLQAARANGASMEPSLKGGDVLVLDEVDGESVQAGDVVLVRHQGWPIMHRVVETYTDALGERIVVTKGDNLSEADPPVEASAVQGELVGKVPWLGAAARALGIGDGFRLLLLLVQGFAATSVVFGLVYLADLRRGNAPVRTTSPAGLIDDA